MSKKIFLALAVLPLLFTSCNKDDDSPSTNELLQGKWRMVMFDNHPCPTNNMEVLTFDNGTLITSASKEGEKSIWEAKRRSYYKLNGNEIEFVHQDGDETQDGAGNKPAGAPDKPADDGTGGLDKTRKIEFISADSLVISQAGPADKPAVQNVYKKINKDYSSDIIGMWEGVKLTGEETYGDINHHWEYKADGTYVYYVKNDQDEWVPKEQPTADYFVDGDWLATSWSDVSGKNYHEWWVIDSIKNGKMYWSAIRTKLPNDGVDNNEEVPIFETTFELKKIQ